jgi:hypothetical protein
MKKLFTVFALLLLLAAPMYARRHRHGRLCRVTHIFYRGPSPVFAGIPGAQLAQNQEIDRLGLPRIANDKQLAALVERGELVPVRSTETLSVAKKMSFARPYLRPWVYDFVLGLSRDFYATFGEPLQVNSMTRPVNVQARLRRVNGNAAPINGPTASAHLAGMAVDLQRRGYTTSQVRWLQLRLLLASSRGNVIVIEEISRLHSCFHVFVSPDERPVPTETVGTPEILTIHEMPDGARALHYLSNFGVCGFH